MKIILLGIIEGITEWLPVSSTGHIILFDRFFSVTDVSDGFMDMFEYVIQLAAILAVVIIFWKKIFPFGLEKKSDQRPKIVCKQNVFLLWLKIVVACLPAVFALVLDMLFDRLSPIGESAVIASTLIVYGIVFILIEKFHKNEKSSISEIAEISYRYAFFIGCFQILAAIPGTSRSGVTIIGALLLGVSRTAAAEFTFILAIPTMVGTSAYKLLKFFLDAGAMTLPELGYLLIGSAVAFIVSLFAVKFLMDFVKKHDFKVFGWYRIALGVLVLAILVVPPLLA
ncbi:MAG: undecaprenyl-diphosphate phosphatase [Clostridia bacterium]|nr:undecaprenyl-diphosphate phosphatase [Clostridia bacterium]